MDESSQDLLGTFLQPSRRYRRLLSCGVDDHAGFHMKSFSLGWDLSLSARYRARQALELLLKKDVAAILLDVHMPDMDGFEAARLIPKHLRSERTPIIFVTGVHVSELDQLRGYEVGAIDYISVPVVPEIMRAKVAVLVELYRRRRALQQLNRALEDARAELAEQHARASAEREEQLRAVLEHPTAAHQCPRARTRRYWRHHRLDLS